MKPPAVVELDAELSLKAGCPKTAASVTSSLEDDGSIPQALSCQSASTRYPYPAMHSL
jgi:hypothetical protein